MQALQKQQGTWKWGLLCLMFLAPFFFLSYGFANHYTASLRHVPSIVFAWEKNIPLWPWTIIPYWSIDFFYGLSLLLCWNKFELRQHVLRLFTAQLLSICCFLLFPLKFSFERPELHGFFGVWFDILMGFDKPFNQAPSLHIVLLVILWDFYRRHIRSPFKWLVDFWSVLIGLSVLTTWQHHFIDIPTGLIVGAWCVWLYPLNIKAPYAKQNQQQRTIKHIKLGSYYILASILLAALASYLQSWALWLFYPALSLFLVGFAYVLVRPYFFQKQSDGKMSPATLILFFPYLLFAWLNSRIRTYKHPNDSEIIHIDQLTIYLGRIPSPDQIQLYNGIFDCCAELPVHTTKDYGQYLSLDLIPLQANQLEYAVEAFDHLLLNLNRSNTLHQKKILIFCALGYSRSTSILCAWLIKHKHAVNSKNALQIVRKGRPWVKLNESHIQQINLYQLKQMGLSP
ncbi:phosphatase PAP2/dual specificity phosphatase family protein [Acinetobacter sp. S40]|uniref:phosphatase PAP2/dual specificity phosphatase family protein n=1 Tax=Acinetobacter sp. S40 TaxID=2767434 RepID=UPI00190D4062|nr:phosphatase PAP2/dual specificity phosphatase family protein [Acinetobacter sp. S40]MBJ9986683.1 phosphatase PAP2/dual specificity phosphatase family protein [Acinetobacter sp. S40]